jgi:hypothetical protein
MSSHPASSSLSPEPSDRKVLYSAIGWVGVILLFALIVLIAYVPNRDQAPGADANETRLAIRQDVDSTQQKLITSYEWIDQAAGTVRIPVDRAMALVVEELSSENAEGES